MNGLMCLRLDIIPLYIKIVDVVLCLKMELRVKGYYLNAIVWKGVEKYDTFTGRVYIDDKNFELIGS